MAENHPPNKLLGSQIFFVNIRGLPDFYLVQGGAKRRMV
jgi:hypothetical protein